MKLFLSAGILIYMFLSSSIVAKIGINQGGTFSSLILITSFILILLADTRYKLVLIFKEEFCIISIGLIIISIKFFLDQSPQVNAVLFFLLVPMALSILVGNQSLPFKYSIKKMVLFFYIIECVISIYERIITKNIFGYTDIIEADIVDNWSFRSSAILGHPLTNALCVSTILGFIIISNFKIGLKIFYLLIGFISLLCFNARASIIIWILLASFFMLKIVFDKKSSRNMVISIVLVFASAIYFVIKLIYDFSFGARIINEKINDSSSQTRLDVYDFFKFLDKSDLWFGNMSNYIPVMKKLGGGGVENSFVVLIINYGIPFFVILFIAYYHLIARFIKNYELENKVIILFSFLILGSTNNALASATPWGFFILCASTFPVKRPKKYKLV